MEWDEQSKEFMLSTGRRFYAFGGSLNISPDGDLRYGFDGTVDEFDQDNPFTQAERAEIASYMIARWQRWSAEAQHTAETER